MIKVFNKKIPRYFYLLLFVLGLFFICWIGRNFFNFSVNFISFGLIILIALISLFLIFIRKPIIGLIFLTVTLPLERIPTLEFVGYTIKINQIIALILLLAFLVHLALKKDDKLTLNPLISFLLLFLSASALSIINSNNLSRSILIFLSFVFISIIFILVSNLVKNEKNLKLITKFLLLTSFLICLFGLYQYFGDLIGLPRNFTGLREAYLKEILGFTRIQSTFLEPLYLANFLIIPLCLISSLFLADQIKLKWYLVVLFLILLLTVFILTVSRSGYLGLAIALLIIIFLKIRSFLSLKKLFPFILAFVISISLAFILLGDARNQFISHNQAPLAGDEQPSSQERETTSKKALSVFYKHPILGIGLGNFGPYYDNYPSLPPKNGWQIVNNEYLEILAETGIFGLVAFLLFLTALFVRSWQAYQKTNNQFLSAFILGASAALFGILVQYYFFSTLYIIYIWSLMGLLVAAQEMAFTKSKSASWRIKS